MGISKKKYSRGGLLAPNGKPSNLNATQYELVRSKEFKDWFGDWEKTPSKASKVVDENGEPLVVYHGTNVEFYEFDLKYFGKTDKGWYGKGFYFTPNRNFTFARDMVEQFGGKEVKLELFLNIKNPFYGEAYAEQNSNLVGSAKDMHRDGVIVLYDYGHELERQIAEIVVWESNQIKLADGTNTTFDVNNPDIRYEDGGITDNGEENFGKPLNFDERIFVHETNKEDANSILENGFKINENPVITNGVYTIPKNWKQNNIGRGGVELEIILKPNKKIFWTDTDRPMDYFLGFGNKFFTKLYKKLNKGEISPYQARVEMNDDNQWFKSKINFSRKMEKWLEDNGYVGIQQGGEVVLTDLSSFVIKNNFEKGGELKKDNVGWTIFGTIALIVTLGKVNALKK
jgi:hypothetical protein